MMGLLQYKAKSQKPYVIECVKQVLISAASVCINRTIAEGCCSKLTLLSDLFLSTKWPSSVILFMQTSDSHMNLWIYCPDICAVFLVVAVVTFHLVLFSPTCRNDLSCFTHPGQITKQRLSILVWLPNFLTGFLSGRRTKRSYFCKCKFGKENHFLSFSMTVHVSGCPECCPDRSRLCGWIRRVTSATPARWHSPLCVYIHAVVLRAKKGI